MASEINIDILGAAQILERYRLKVPPNQREYAWQRRVERLLEWRQERRSQGLRPRRYYHPRQSKNGRIYKGHW